MPRLPAQITDVVNLGEEIEVTFLIDGGEQVVGRFPFGAVQTLSLGQHIDLYLSLDRAALVTDDIGIGNAK